MDPVLAATAPAATVVATLRQWIIDGRLPAGERVAELPIAESLGVSRTPVRLAFRSLAQEGLLTPAGKRGYLVRRFSETDVRAAIEVRGALEGLAARDLAQRGLGAGERAALLECLADGAALLAKRHLVEDDVDRWARLNERFHDTIVASAASRVIGDAIARNDHLPFASASSITLDPRALHAEYEKLRIAQLQHQLVFDALDRREAARVEMLMREHAWVGFRYGRFLGLEPGPLAGARG
ncbi:MAG TPA: GntR family transcriptional regulator [Methylibium sp.]|nr:GntR family transcriptional regulator [Methylibium sp.]